MSESLESEISLSNPTMDIKEDLIKAAARIVLAVIAVLCVTIFFLWPTKRETARAVITKDRRSVVKYKGAVPAPTLERALTAAIHAPNHFLNEPWRFRVLGPATVAKLVALNEAKREIFEGVPGWLMVSVVPTAGDTLWNPKALEDHAATACAVQNFMLSLGECARVRRCCSHVASFSSSHVPPLCVRAASESCGSKWMTGALGIPPAKIMEAVGVDAAEHFMGIVFFGKPAVPTASMAVPARKKGLGEPVLTKLP